MVTIQDFLLNYSVYCCGILLVFVMLHFGFKFLTYEAVNKSLPLYWIYKVDAYGNALPAEKYFVYNDKEYYIKSKEHKDGVILYKNKDKNKYFVILDKKYVEIDY